MTAVGNAGQEVAWSSWCLSTSGSRARARPGWPSCAPTVWNRWSRPCCAPRSTWRRRPRRTGPIPRGGVEADVHPRTFLSVDPRDRQVVGTCGFRGPVRGGRVEIAFWTFPPFEGRGWATAMTRTLVARAFEDPSVHTVVAHTLPERAPAASVLTANGLVRVQSRRRDESGPGGAVRGTVWRWETAPADARERRPGPLSDTGGAVILHLCTREELAAARAEGARRPPSLDEVGFVHLLGPGDGPPARLAALRGPRRRGGARRRPRPPGRPRRAGALGARRWARRAPRTRAGRGSPTPTARCPWPPWWPCTTSSRSRTGRSGRRRSLRSRGAGPAGTYAGRRERRTAPDLVVGGRRARSGDRIRTCDLWVMSPASYRAAPPRAVPVALGWGSRPPERSPEPVS